MKKILIILLFNITFTHCISEEQIQKITHELDEKSTEELETIINMHHNFQQIMNASSLMFLAPCKEQNTPQREEILNKYISRVKQSIEKQKSLDAINQKELCDHSTAIQQNISQKNNTPPHNPPLITDSPSLQALLMCIIFLIIHQCSY